MKNLIACTLAGFLLLTPIAQTLAAALAVKNVSFTQDGKNIIINYDLIGDANKKCDISLELSEDYGTSYSIQPYSVAGDIGKDVYAGYDKKIIWYMTQDFPDGLEGGGFVFAVEAKQKEDSKAIWYILGAGAAGGAVYYFSQPKEKGSISVSIPGEF